MKKLLTLLCFSVFLFSLSTSYADSLRLKANHPTRYTVKKGDTLWDISGKFLKNAWQWPKLWGYNPQVNNPHKIYPGDVLVLTIVNGKPRLSLAPRVVRLSPNMRIVAKASAIPPIPLKSIEPFLTKSRVMSVERFLSAPYVLSHDSDHLMSTTGNLIFARGLSKPNQLRYVVLRKDETYFDPRTKKVLGIEAQYVASAEVEKFADPASLRVISANQVINEGDRLFAVKHKSGQTAFIPHAPKKEVNAQIIAVLRGVTQIGRNNIVALNYGDFDGANPGQVLSIMRVNGIVKDRFAKKGATAIRLPEKKIGDLMVFKVFPSVSFALVMHAKQTIRVLDKVQSPR
jgi:LysM repeat protein